MADADLMVELEESFGKKFKQVMMKNPELMGPTIITAACQKRILAEKANTLRLVTAAELRQSSGQGFGNS